MKNLVITALGAVSIACLVFCAVIWNDNRHLLRDMADGRRGCVDRESHRTLVDVCERLSVVNARQETYLRRVGEMLEGVDERGYGEVWRASGRRKNRGLGRGGPAVR